MLKALLLIPLYFFARYQKVVTVKYTNGENRQEAAEKAKEIAEKMEKTANTIRLKVVDANDEIVTAKDEVATAEGADAVGKAKAKKSKAHTKLRNLEEALINAETGSDIAQKNAELAKIATHRIGSMHVDFSELLRIYTMIFAIPLVGEVAEKIAKIAKSGINWTKDVWDSAGLHIRILMIFLGLILLAVPVGVIYAILT